MLYSKEEWFAKSCLRMMMQIMYVGRIDVVFAQNPDIGKY